MCHVLHSFSGQQILRFMSVVFICVLYCIFFCVSNEVNSLEINTTFHNLDSTKYSLDYKKNWTPINTGVIGHSISVIKHSASSSFHIKNIHQLIRFCIIYVKYFFHPGEHSVTIQGSLSSSKFVYMNKLSKMF
jgi:hypothetical protein